MIYRAGNRFNEENYFLTEIDTSVPSCEVTGELDGVSVNFFGNVEEGLIIGGNVVWNQVSTSGNFVSSTGWSFSNAEFSVHDNIGSFTATMADGRISTTTRVANNHIYLATAQVKSSSDAVRMNWWTQTGNTAANDTFETVALIDKVVYEGTSINYPRFVDGRSSDWDEVQIKQLMVFDLTLMFGETIAEYILNLERTTIGAGVALFKTLFAPDNYYSYNAGTEKTITLR